MTLPFVHLLLLTARTMAGRWKTLVAGTVVMGFLFFSLQILSVTVREGYRAHRISNMLLAYDMQKTARLQEQARTGSAQAAAALRTMRDQVATHASSFLHDGFSFSSGRIADAAIEGLFSIFSLIIMTVLAMVWMLSVFILPSEADDPAPVLRRSGRHFRGFLLLLGLLFFFSFLWIPLLFAGYIRLLGPSVGDVLGTADMCILFLAFGSTIILLPRLLPAPFIFLQEELSPMDSIRESVRRSRGQWGRLSASGTGAILVSAFFLLLLQDLPAAVLPLSPALDFANAIIVQGVAVFVLLFLRSLCHTVLGYGITDGQESLLSLMLQRKKLLSLLSAVPR